MSGRDVVSCPSCGAANRVARDRVEAGERAICGRCRAPLGAGGAPLVVGDDSWDEVVVRSPLPVLVDFWAPWCAPCRTLAPVIEGIAAETSGRWRVAKLNTDENPETAARLRIQGIPTLVFFRGGRELDRLVGAHPREAILGRLAALG